MSESATTESGPLSVDQAIAALVPEIVEDAAPEAPVEAAAEPEEIEAEASPAEETPDEAETPAEGEEEAQETEPVVALDPPPYWKQEAKAVFATLTPEQQAVVLEQEGPREEITAKVKAEAAERRQQADAEIGKVQQLANQLAEFLPQALATFQSRWGAAPDWQAYAQEHGVEAMVLAKTQHETEAAQLQRLATETAQADAIAREAFVKGEFQTLAEIAPELADPEKGAEKRTEVTHYLVKQGIDPQAIQQISAREMVLAQKAMLYDRAQAALKAKPAVKPAAPAPKPAAVRPAAGVAQSPTERSATQVANRFAQTRSVDDAVALLLARKA